MYNPVSTYRIQFHKGFTFTELEKIIPYLSELGISTLYASPIFEATPGSTHGYDVINPLHINPEIGTLEQLKSIHRQLHKYGIGWIQDIVPNHMAYHPDNVWLMDVLEKGTRSAYATYFDILWDNPLYNGRVMVPFLGSPVDEVIEKQQLQIAYKNNKLTFVYSGQVYPLNLASYVKLLPVDKNYEELNIIIHQITEADQIKNVEKYSEAVENIINNQAPVLKKIFTHTYLKKINSDAKLLKTIATEQHYQLCFWQETDNHINFRRFFTVNGLICLNMQHQVVFDHYHQLIKSLLKAGIFQGLRVDHIDGLYNPSLYLKQLRSLAGPDTYIIVEKILEQGELFPESWPVQGNTGYDHLGLVNNLLTNPNSKSKSKFSQFYNSLINPKTDAHQGIISKKSLILFKQMAGELENLYQLFIKLKLAKPAQLKNIQPADLKNAIAQLLIQFPVYRFYDDRFPLAHHQSNTLHQLFKEINRQHPELKFAVKLLEEALLKNTSKGNDDYNNRCLLFYQRLMQFTGPLMAKGVEDTLMYTYNRFIDHNEVGDSPEAFGIKISDFNKQMLSRQKNWSLTMNATSTHDTKRGEDVRARLNVLTDVADEWIKHVKLWLEMNAGLKTDALPDVNDEYFIYQTIAGAYPLPQQHEDDFDNRIQQYLIKALREAKLNSNWANPNDAYEKATNSFITKLLDKNSEFWISFCAFQQKIAPYAVVNSLAQVLLKYTLPGMPDLYQGCEFWDLSLVDPDNRRPVDYNLRKKLLKNLKGYTSPLKLWQYLWQNKHNPQIKLALTNLLLSERKQNVEVFAEGEYISLKAKGKYKQNIFAFARRFKQTWYIIAIPLHLAEIVDEDTIENFDWQDTRLILPAEAPLEWENVLYQTKGITSNGIAINSIFKPVCLAILRLNHPERGAGLLLHITSLPSPFGIGDIGPEAYKAADILYHSRQKYWQLLPVNTVQSQTGYSPYSPVSGMAGNTLLISPQLLITDGLLDKEELKQYQFDSLLAEYDRALTVKNEIFDVAYKKYIQLNNFSEFDNFKKQEAYWLDNFALYETLKNRFNGKPWYEWPDEFKLRKTNMLVKLSDLEHAHVEKTKWLQYVFAKQWRAFKSYCNNKNIRLIGDIPYYVSYDSADVWSHTNLFELDNKGNIVGMAGVPPDYFSTEGQLWGMPLYRWDAMKSDNYQWWINRIKKNVEYFDLIRLDHFRAFVDYWEVPAGSKTAVIGQWKQGTGKDLFNYFKREFGELPLIVEDLGDITPEVYSLRDEFNLPGMLVLQFAFGNDLPISTHAPHNYTTNSVVYTGTHDNNTTRGWYDNEISKQQRKLIDHYTGKKVKPGNIHKTMIRLCYASAAKTVIVPIQDVLGMDENSRMNVPSSTQGNWTWRLRKKELSAKNLKYISRLAVTYNR